MEGGVISLIIILMAIALILKFSPRKSPQKSEKASSPFPQSPHDAHRPSQLQCVMAASFHKKRIMNKSEYHVFRLVEAMLRKNAGGLRVFSQTSMGEFIGSEDRQAFDAINSKRIDILIIDASGHPAAAIEYQGAGHYQGDAVVRDAVKREALRKAGVPFVEILENDSDEWIQRKITEALGWPAVAQQPGAPTVQTS